MPMCVKLREISRLRTKPPNVMARRRWRLVLSALTDDLRHATLGPARWSRIRRPFRRRVAVDEVRPTKRRPSRSLLPKDGCQKIERNGGFKRFPRKTTCERRRNRRRKRVLGPINRPWAGLNGLLIVRPSLHVGAPRLKTRPCPTPAALTRPTRKSAIFTCTAPTSLPLP